MGKKQEQSSAKKPKTGKSDDKNEEKQKPVIKQSHLFEMVVIKKPDEE